METILKFDKFILVKELNDKFKKVGESFEVANIFDDSFLLREAKSKVAVGVISFKDFENHFVKEESFKGWTNWTRIIGFDGQNDAFYRTNGKKVQVRFLTDKVRAEASCNLKFEDKFNLFFGLNLAYLRCLNKALNKQKALYEKKIKKFDSEIIDNVKTMEKMISSLEA